MVNKYLYLYTGGEKLHQDQSCKEAVKEWCAYFGKIHSAIVDHGAPFGAEERRVGQANTSRATGYSIVHANSLNEAIALTEGHPHIARGGGIEVFELVDLSGM
ncbi:hypothetical protein [Methylovirgula sp. 4M-Z18]|uniref:hypothetical protein n=1 Tax=Methylovirgula sp. 4M-Z18 TaxID=2293567 RepID=UPI000E2E7860|nr:hypothetical protein [Methylovirgula sp. 4M-Z18]RFB79315.1 hypothetical protein DYH55_12165 [Methylovirgula sp. 4M-Z18]